MPPRPPPPSLWSRRDCLLGACALAWPQAWAEDRPAEPLRIGVDPQSLSDVLAACAAVAKRAYALTGVPMQLQTLPSRRSLEMANAGELDGDLARVAETVAECPNLILVPEELAHLEVRAIAREPLPADFKLEDARARTVICRRGIRAVERALAGFPNVLEDDSTEDALRHLRAGHADLVIWSVVPGAPNAQQLSGLHLSVRPMLTFSLFHVLHKRHSALVPHLSQALRHMETSGELAQLRRTRPTALVPPPPAASAASAQPLRLPREP